MCVQRLRGMQYHGSREQGEQTWRQRDRGRVSCDKIPVRNVAKEQMQAALAADILRHLNAVVP